jgi:Flp pilus assembly protein TadD
MPAPLLRAGLVLAAALLVAWSAVLWRGDQIGSDASDKIIRNANLPEAAWAHEMERLRDAELLDPSTRWPVARAGALYQRGRLEQSAAVLDDVLEKEPDNLEAWLYMREVVRGRDPAREADARAAIRRLNPTPPEN